MKVSGEINCCPFQVLNHHPCAGNATADMTKKQLSQQNQLLPVIHMVMMVVRMMMVLLNCSKDDNNQCFRGRITGLIKMNSLSQIMNFTGEYGPRKMPCSECLKITLI